MSHAGDAVIVGLGNPILSDDGIGWRVAQALRAKLETDTLPPALASVQVLQACVGGLSLAEMLAGYERALIVDAIVTRKAPPGTIHWLSLRDLPGTLNTASTHDTNLMTALRALRRLGADVPRDDEIAVIAVEAADVLTFGERCTPAVEAALPDACALVLDWLRSQVAV